MSNNIFHHEEIYRGDLKKLSKKVLICGGGAVGSNIINNLNRQGFNNLAVIDFDRVEKHNINTQTYSLDQVGMLKVDALQNMVYQNTCAMLEVENKKLDDKNYSKLLTKYKPNIIVDGFDNTVARQLVTAFSKENKIPCLHVGLFEDYAEVIWNEKYKVPQVKEGQDVCDYPLARNIIQLATTVASEEIVNWCFGKGKRNFTITLKDLKINSSV